MTADEPRYLSQSLTALGKILREVLGAAGKFPANVHMTSALAEEVGELSNALLEHHRGNLPAQKVYDEAMQVAAMAIRIALEGSAEFPRYLYDEEMPQAFRPTGTPKAPTLH